jgi:molybdate-binding protein
VIPKEHYGSELLAPLLETLVSEAFASEVSELAGYDLQRPGEILAELG